MSWHFTLYVFWVQTRRPWVFFSPNTSNKGHSISVSERRGRGAIYSTHVTRSPLVYLSFKSYISDRKVNFTCGTKRTQEKQEFYWLYNNNILMVTKYRLFNTTVLVILLCEFKKYDFSRSEILHRWSFILHLCLLILQ